MAEVLKSFAAGDHCTFTIQMACAEESYFIQCNSKLKTLKVQRKWTPLGQPNMVRISGRALMTIDRLYWWVDTFNKRLKERGHLYDFTQVSDRYNPKKQLMWSLSKQLAVANFLELGAWLKRNKEMVVAAGGYFIPKSISGEEPQWVDYEWPEDL